MKKISLIIIFIFLTACAYLPGDLESIELPKWGREQLFEEKEFQKGTDALSIRFVQEATPKDVRENSLFDIIFELQNKGYSDISEGLFKLITEEQYIKLEKDRGTIMLKGKSQYMPEGEAKRVKFNAKAGLIDENLMEFPVKMTMIACYGYETISAESVCIDPDVEGLKKDKACTPKEMILTGGQGAPVTITKIVPKMSFGTRGAMPEFEISLENKGEGQVIAQEFIEHACGAKPRERTQEYDQITVEAELSNQRLRCEPEKITIKKGKEVKVICEQETPLKRRDAYLSPLIIGVRYGYITSAFGDVAITKRLRT